VTIPLTAALRAALRDELEAARSLRRRLHAAPRVSGDEADTTAQVARIKAADIVLFCTPIWWGGRSSLMQRVIERLDALDEEYSASGRSAIKGKVAGIVITGSEDGALSVMGSIMMVLSFMGFTLPPG